MNTISIDSKEKRKRITREMHVIGEVVAKSYVDMDFRKNVTRQIVLYKKLSREIISRKIEPRTEVAC